MKSLLLLYPLAISCVCLTTVAEKPPTLPPYQWMKDRLLAASGHKRSVDIKGDQARLMDPPNIVLPPSNDGNNGQGAPDSSSGVTISDVISSQRRINIFSGFTRDIGTISERLEDGGQNSTILAPENPAISKLPRKPWEDPRDYQVLGADAYSGSDGEDRAHKNLRRFVEAHVVPQSPWEEGKKVQTLAGSTVWFEKKEGKTFVRELAPIVVPLANNRLQIEPGDVEVDSVASKVSNGEIWILKGVLNYQ